MWRSSGANTRVIAGSASIGAAKAGVGAVVSLASLADQVAAAVGNAAKVTALGDIAVSAAAEGEVWDVSVADATALDASNFVSVGGGVNVVLSVNARDLASYEEATSSWAIAGGEYKFLIGASSRDIKATLKADVAASSEKTDDILKPRVELSLLKR